MNYKVFLSRQAQVELGIAECFFRTKGLDRKFLEDFDRQIRYLEMTPESFQVRYRSIRIIALDKFNYSIHYTLRNEEVLVLRILNQKQDF